MNNLEKISTALVAHQGACDPFGTNVWEKLGQMSQIATLQSITTVWPLTHHFPFWKSLNFWWFLSFLAHNEIFTLEKNTFLTHLSRSKQECHNFEISWVCFTADVDTILLISDCTFFLSKDPSTIDFNWKVNF